LLLGQRRHGRAHANSVQVPSLPSPGAIESHIMSPICLPGPLPVESVRTSARLAPSAVAPETPSTTAWPQTPPTSAQHPQHRGDSARRCPGRAACHQGRLVAAFASCATDQRNVVNAASNPSQSDQGILEVAARCAVLRYALQLPQGAERAVGMLALNAAGNSAGQQQQMPGSTGHC
jgi:hypothetical protein